MEKKPITPPPVKKDEPRKIRRPLQRKSDASNRFLAIFSELDAAGILVILGGILMGRATILGTLWPFGQAYFAAISAVMPKARVMAAIGLIAGAFTTGVQGRVVIMLLSVLLIASMVKSLDHEHGRSLAYKPAALAGVLGFVPVAIVGAISQAPPYSYLMALVEAAAAIGLTLAYAQAVPVLTGSSKSLRQEDVASACLLVASLVAGVSELAVGPLELRNIVASLITMMLASAGGAGIGAAAGASVGVVIALSRPISPLVVGTQALSGLLGGALGRAGKIGAAVGVFLGGIALLLPTEQSAVLTKSILEISIAALVFLVARPPQRLTRLFATQNGAVAEPRSHMPKVQELVAVRLHEFARVLRELSKSYAQVAATTGVDRDLGAHYERLCRRVCEDCNQYSRCWDGSFFKKHSLMSALVSMAETRPSLTLQDAPLELKQACPKAHELVITAVCIADLIKAQRVWASRSQDMKGVLSAQLKGVSSVVDGIAGEVRGATLGLAPRKREIDYEISIARRAKQGSVVCGDSVLHKETKEGKLVLILSDGMGSGAPAALESKATVALLEQLIDNGFETDLAVQTVNSFMGLKFPEDTFATVDMAIIDLITGDAEFTKRSAAPSFIKRENEVAMLTASSLPIGILGQSEADRTHKVLRPGDVLVMVTDGALQWVRAAKKDEPYANFIGRLKVQHADEVSGRLLDKVLEAGKESLNDDVTILCVRFVPAEAKSALPAN